MSNKLEIVFGSLSIVAVLGIITTILLAVAGWFMNIWAVLDMSFSPTTTELVLRVIGIPIPIVGAVMGWM